MLKKRKGGKVFGVPLTSNTIPPIVLQCVEYLETPGKNFIQLEGIFRQSGNAAVVNDTRAKFNKGEEVDLMATQADPHAVAGVLKLWFRELPEALLTFAYYDMFIAAIAIPNTQMKLQKIRQILQFLPKPHLVLLKYLVLFLHRVAALSAINKMQSTNLAIVFGPNVLRPNGFDVSVMLEDSSYSNEAMAFLIDNCEDVFKGLDAEPSPSPDTAAAEPASGDCGSTEEEGESAGQRAKKFFGAAAEGAEKAAEKMKEKAQQQYEKAAQTLKARKIEESSPGAELQQVEGDRDKEKDSSGDEPPSRRASEVRRPARPPSVSSPSFAAGPTSPSSPSPSPPLSPQPIHSPHSHPPPPPTPSRTPTPPSSPLPSAASNSVARCKFSAAPAPAPATAVSPPGTRRPSLRTPPLPPSAKPFRQSSVESTSNSSNTTPSASAAHTPHTHTPPQQTAPAAASPSPLPMSSPRQLRSAPPPPGGCRPAIPLPAKPDGASRAASPHPTAAQYTTRPISPTVALAAATFGGRFNTYPSPAVQRTPACGAASHKPATTTSSVVKPNLVGPTAPRCLPNTPATRH
eukprot:TRINITY_DN4230_c0_g1_i1.p1 TRINITY_DN4230_c0_g1~~TRINITY_DN4230_c0_g1_i1.p1  ORF type:complete len:593 (+),score=132.49 TRINITY_DN4230_c0_g1_i1:62-1780(+)